MPTNPKMNRIVKFTKPRYIWIFLIHLVDWSAFKFNLDLRLFWIADEESC